MRRLAEVLKGAIAAHGLSGHVPISGKPCNLVFGTLDRDKRPSQHFRALLMQELVARGVIAPSLVISYSHDDAAVDRTVEAFDGAMPVYRRALESGPEGLLHGPPTAPVYRRRNARG